MSVIDRTPVVIHVYVQTHVTGKYVTHVTYDLRFKMNSRDNDTLLSLVIPLISTNYNREKVL